jgi:hypothetical protein
MGDVRETKLAPAYDGPRERRRHLRRRANLILKFRRLRDLSERVGIVRDISQGGLRFAASERLGVGETLNLVISGKTVETRIRAVAVVVRATPRGGGYEIGARFTGRDKEIRLSDRRRQRRIVADFEVRYRRPATGRADVGRVRDISQGGIRFVAGERMTPGEMLTIMLDAGAAGVIEAEMKALLRVVSSAAVLGSSDIGDRYEIRARFVNQE